MQQQMEALDAQEVSSEQKIEMYAQSLRQKLFSSEIQRRSFTSDSQKEETVAVARNWIRVLRSLTVERAPWGTTSKGRVQCASVRLMCSVLEVG